MAAHELDASELVAWRNAVLSPWGPRQATTRHVLTVLSMHMNFELIASPSIELLALRSGLSDRAVSKHLQAAEQQGWVHSWYERRNGRAWFHTKYEGQWPGELEADDFMPGNCYPSDWRSLDPDELPPHPERRSPREVAHPERGSRHPENDDATPRTSVHDTPNEVPTNSLLNSSLIVPEEHHAPRDVFSPMGEKGESPESVRHRQAYSVSEALWMEVCNAGNYYEEGRFRLKAAIRAKDKLNDLLMKHGDTRCMETWRSLVVKDIDHLAEAMEATEMKTASENGSAVEGAQA